jgi:hypothetical protein
MDPGFYDPQLSPEGLAENYAKVESIEGFSEPGPFKPSGTQLQIPATTPGTTRPEPLSRSFRPHQIAFQPHAFTCLLDRTLHFGVRRTAVRQPAFRLAGLAPL